MKVRRGLKRRLQEDATIFIKMRYADGMYEIYMAFLDPWSDHDKVLYRTDVFKDAESLLKNCRYEHVMNRIRTLKEERINRRVSKL